MPSSFTLYTWCHHHVYWMWHLKKSGLFFLLRKFSNFYFKVAPSPVKVTSYLSSNSLIAHDYVILIHTTMQPRGPEPHHIFHFLFNSYRSFCCPPIIPCNCLNSAWVPIIVAAVFIQWNRLIVTISSCSWISIIIPKECIQSCRKSQSMQNFMFYRRK